MWNEVLLLISIRRIEKRKFKVICVFIDMEMDDSYMLNEFNS